MTVLRPDTAARKMGLYRQGVGRSTAFLEHNGISVPAFVIDNLLGSAGEYDPRTHTVRTSLKRSTTPARNPGFSWSFPGFKADRTPYGVPAHEVGHHIHAVRLANLPTAEWGLEAPVSGYEPNRVERIAEALRLMITNPDLLRVGRPVRYRSLVLAGLAPIDDRKWDDVLRAFDASDRYVTAAENWIRKGRRT